MGTGINQLPGAAYYGKLKKSSFWHLCREKSAHYTKTPFFSTRTGIKFL